MRSVLLALALTVYALPALAGERSPMARLAKRQLKQMVWKTPGLRTAERRAILRIMTDGNPLPRNSSSPLGTPR